MNYFKNLAYVLLLSFSSCLEKEDHELLDKNEKSLFSGTFETYNSDDITGEVAFQIENGAYECTTSLHFGRGAGILEVEEDKINFVDTLFFPVPHLYGPSYTLSGAYQYRFDGQKLTLWKSKNVGENQYQLQKKE